MQRNQLIAIVLIVVIVGSVGAFLLLAPPPVTGNSYVHETIGNPDFMDPHVNYETFGSWMHYNIYETLYTYEWDTAVTDPNVPLLAESLEISADGLNYTFTLRQGVTFHDGTPFNADAVKYNFERVMAIFDGWGPAWMFAEPILGGGAVEDAVYTYGEGSQEHIDAYNAWLLEDAIIVMSDYVVRLRLAYPYTPFLAAITYEVGAMMSPTWVEANGGVTIGEHNAFVDENACGTGPYMLQEWIPDQHVKLEKNPTYWRAAEATAQYANAGDLAFITIKTNEEVNSRILNIKANQTHGTYWPTNHANEVWNGVTGADGDGTLKSSVDNLKVFAGNPGFNVMFLGFNMNPYLNKSGVTTLSPFVNKSVRESFSYAFDYDTFIDSVVNGFGEQLQGPVPVGMFGHYDDLYMYNYNLTKAAEFWNLAMADGWLDGVLANNSNDLTIYYNSGNTVREAACLLLKDGIEEMLDNATYGAIQPAEELTITIQPLEWSSYLFQVRNKQLPIFFLGWAPDYADPDNYVGPFVKSTGTYPNRIGLGISDGWDAAEVDGWISDAAQSSSDSERENLYQNVQEAIVDHVAYLWCYQSTSFQVRHISVNGYVFNPMHNDYFYHMWLS